MPIAYKMHTGALSNFIRAFSVAFKRFLHYKPSSSLSYSPSLQQVSNIFSGSPMPAVSSPTSGNGLVASPLLKAAERADFEQIKINNDESIFCRFIDAAIGDLNMLEKLHLIDRIGDHKGRTALHLAARGGKIDAVKYLIKVANLNPNEIDQMRETPLHCAIHGGQFDIAVFLLDNGANPRAATGQNITPLHYAVEKGERYLRLLIWEGAEIDAQADYGTPLQHAAKLGNKEAVKILLDNHANPNKTLQHLLSPLMLSIENGSTECVNQLLKAGAEPNLLSMGVRPLEFAASLGRTEIVKLLLNSGSNPNNCSHLGYLPIQVAALCGHEEIVNILFPETNSFYDNPNSIMQLLNSDQAREQWSYEARERSSLLKSKGDDILLKRDYLGAIDLYTEARQTDKLNENIVSNLSLCWACLKEGYRALADAQSCVKLKPEWPKAHFREGVAWKILRDFSKAADSFFIGLLLDPENEELQRAHWHVKATIDRRPRFGLENDRLA